MLTHDEYLMAWGLYLLAGSGMFFVFWRMTCMVSLVTLRRVMRVSVAVMLFMPWFSYDGQDYLAPAFLIAAFETLVQGSELWARAGMPLVVVLLTAMSMTILFSVIFKKR